ncbi:MULTISPECIES: CopG family antitoxin [unclassified Microcoleus]|uniref:CopG family antitoxin n=1 Tax=unclassified Microcoleus TaxID=2642155 RepID=UPI0025D17EAE|nr:MULTISPECIES: CopG family antitoxin [unclassified Microcoleus]
MLNEENTEKRKSAISEAESYQQIGEFWDARDLADYWEETDAAEFSVNLQSEITYYRVEVTLSEQIRSIAKRQGVSPETLLNLWVQEKLSKEIA